MAATSMLAAIDRALIPTGITLTILLLGSWLGARRRLINEIKLNHMDLWFELGSPEAPHAMMFRKMHFVGERLKNGGAFRTWFSEKSYMKLENARVTTFARRLELLSRIFIVETGLFVGYGILRAYFS